MSKYHKPKDCDEVKEMSQNKATTGIYRIRPDGSSNFLVRCDMETLGGGWTVIQRRVSASDFFQDWTTYQIGFGSVDTNYWLGLQQIHNISTQGQYELLVFELGDVKSKYELTVDGYEGTAGDSLSHHSGQPFSTRDKDSDSYGGNCAEIYFGLREGPHLGDIQHILQVLDVSRDEDKKKATII
ncbi:FIBA-like protein [Mya arenaria]|uniref:FIBA-like protein n=1 Tax=Mya arenaria TaxID=6604 RepID=A0ABY7F6K8_MYAAR|nr:FIBA-like protein [Mya arenaria]